ncbi:MAG TPA: hypothetical protein VI248_17785 [Kineosporiaceae bacterium]
MEIITCPDPDCGAPAEIVDRWTVQSTDGPVEHVTTRCLHRHRFTPRVERLRGRVAPPSCSADSSTPRQSGSH